MSIPTEWEAYEILHSQRRWRTVERIGLRLVAVATAVFVIGLVAAGTVVLMGDTASVRGVMDQ